MKYSVPNAPDVPYLDQAEPDDFDFQALGNRRTGIVSGGGVSALGTPGPSVQVAAGLAIIKDIPVPFNAGTVAVANGGGNARLDLIAVSNQGVLTNIAGAASSNALFTDFDFETFAPLAAVYVPPGSTSVLGSHIALKAPSMPESFVRTYSTAGSRFLGTSTPATNFEVFAEGEMRWGGLSKLKRLANNAMEWVTSLKLRSNDDALPALILEARPNTGGTKVLRVQSNGGTELGYINGEGQLYADNYKFGTGDPNGVVTGKLGDLFVSRDNGGTSLGIWQKGGADGTSIDWKSYRVFDPSESALPTGSIIHSMSYTAPTGFIAAQGQWIDTTGTTAALAAMVGARFGAQPGQVKMPDLRDYTLAGAGSILTFGGFTGAASLTLTTANMPAHNHTVNDPGHSHPEGGPHVYMRPYQFHNNRHPTPSSQPLEHLWTEPSDFDRSSRTGITVNNAGAGQPISMYQPTFPVHLYIKL